MARRLADTPGHHVTLIEAGSDRPPDGRRGASFFDALAEPGRVHPGPFVRGRGLGGSSAVNGMIATPGDPRQYESWGWRDAGAALDRVLVPREPPALTSSARSTGHCSPRRLTRRSRPLTRRGRHRVTSADAYLAVRPPNLRIMTDATVAAVSLEGRRATGVVLGRRHDRRGRRVVVVAAGAIGSPALLARSGVEVDGLGDGLRNHPAVPVTLTLADGRRRRRSRSRHRQPAAPRRHPGPSAQPSRSGHRWPGDAARRADGTDGLGAGYAPATGSRSSSSRSATTTVGRLDGGRRPRPGAARPPGVRGAGRRTSPWASHRPACSTPRRRARWAGWSTTAGR